MLSLSMIGLVVVALAMREPGPDDRATKIEAAAKAEEAGQDAAAEAILAAMVAEDDRPGAEGLDLAEDLERLGTFYFKTHRRAPDRAEALLRRALAIRERLQGPDHPDVAETLYNLAVNDMIAEGEKAEGAVGLLRRAAAIWEKEAGPGRIQAARALHALAAIRMKRGEPGDAERLMQRALELREDVLGMEHPKVADLLDDLGDLHTAQMSGLALSEDAEKEHKRHGEQAEQYYKRSLAIRETALGPDHKDVSETLFNLGQLAIEREKPAEGEAYLLRLAAIQEKAPTMEAERLSGNTSST